MAAWKFEKYDNVNVTITIQHGGPLDIYIMKCTEFDDHYDKNESFKAAVSKQNVNGTVELKWEKDDTSIYCFVVDNWDNARNDDAIPSEDAKISYWYEIDNNSHARTLRLITLTGVVIGVIIIAVTAIYVKVKLD